MKQFYECDMCGKLYDTEEECSKCEARHKVEKTELNKAVEQRDKLSDELDEVRERHHEIYEKYVAACKVVDDLVSKSSTRLTRSPFFDFLFEL